MKNQKKTKKKRVIWKVLLVMLIATVSYVVYVKAREKDETSDKDDVPWTNNREDGTDVVDFVDLIFNGSNKNDDEYIENNGKGNLQVLNIMQKPELPTGCEVTSLAIVLNYLGFNVDKCDLADNYLDKGSIGITDIDKAFVGNPRSNSSYGCYASVIVNCANKWLTEHGSSYRAYNMTGKQLERLFCEIDSGRPVIVWATINMVESSIGPTWFIPDGYSVTYIAQEHCLVLTGYDMEKGVVYVADPLVGNTSYDLEVFRKRYEELMYQAVIIK